MNRVFFELGPVTIYWYSVLILLALIIGYFFAIRYCKKIGYNISNIDNMLFYLILWSIVGARSYYVIFNFSIYKNDLLGIFMIWRGGLAIYGAIIGAVSYLYCYCYKRNLNFIQVLDMFSLSLLLGQSIGRWGNFFNSEAYGGITTYTNLKNLKIPEFVIRGMYIDGAYRVPTFLYESLWCLVGVLILVVIRSKYFKKIGAQIYFYLIWYGMGRFFIEGLRSDSLMIGNFRISQIVSILIFIIGMIGMIKIYLESGILKKKKVK